MSPGLKVSHTVIERMSRVKEKCSGSLFGVMYDSTLLVFGFNIELRLENANARDLKVWSTEAHNNLVNNLPTEGDVCGIITIGEDISSEKCKENALILLEQVDVTDNPLLLSIPAIGSKDIKTHFYINEKLEEKPYEIIHESELWREFLHVRLQGRLPIVSELDENELRDALRSLHKKVATGMLSFYFPNTNVYLMGGEVGVVLSGLSGEPSIGELWDLSTGSKNVENLAEGPNIKMKKSKQKFMDVDVLNVNILMRPTTEGRSESQLKSATVIQHVKKTYNCLKMATRVDALSIVSRKTKLVDLYPILVESACRNIKLTEQCVLSQLSKTEKHPDHGDNVPSIPEPFHFLPQNLNHFVTLLYPKGHNDEKHELIRGAIHKGFALPMDRPFFRKGNAHRFLDEMPANAPLINPHEGLGPSGVKDGEVSIVQGIYSYHHYMQDRMDDDGWGCAYRSLQTLVSWFRWQGYTQHPIPTHREIQQCLVKLKDKPPSFVGSTQWIGSTEVYMCLESMLGVTSKVLCVSSGEELGSKGGELAIHFQMEGTPIMIGGGVLAHTILGVDFNRKTGDLKFLILDPHYTGGDDLGIIQGKGWCGWKGVNFWSKNAFYNLCMPLRPRCI